MQVAYPTQLKDHFEIYRFFNGLAAEGKEGFESFQGILDNSISNSGGHADDY